jgi:hypothetical protein
LLIFGVDKTVTTEIKWCPCTVPSKPASFNLIVKSGSAWEVPARIGRWAKLDSFAEPLYILAWCCSTEKDRPLPVLCSGSSVNAVLLWQHNIHSLESFISVVSPGKVERMLSILREVFPCYFFPLNWWTNELTEVCSRRKVCFLLECVMETKVQTPVGIYDYWIDFIFLHWRSRVWADGGYARGLGEQNWLWKELARSVFNNVTMCWIHILWI